jgi:hypothetical protein
MHVLSASAAAKSLGNISKLAGASCSRVQPFRFALQVGAASAPRRSGRKDWSKVRKIPLRHLWHNSLNAMAELGAKFCRGFDLPRVVADIILLRDGKTYFLEVKRPGAYQSPEQTEFQARAEQAGAVHAVVRSMEDAQRLGL